MPMLDPPNLEHALEPVTYEEVVECDGEIKRVSYTSYHLPRDNKMVLHVSVSDDEGGDPFEFWVDDQNSWYRRFEPHACGVYVVREFGYDLKQSPPFLPNFSVEVWRYRFDGRGENILTLSEWTDRTAQLPTLYYIYDIRVDPSEQVIALQRSHPGAEEFALIFKDIESGSDVLVIPKTRLHDELSAPADSMQMRVWSDDGSIFWWRWLDNVGQSPTALQQLLALARAG